MSSRKFNEGSPLTIEPARNGVIVKPKDESMNNPDVLVFTSLDKLVEHIERHFINSFQGTMP